MGVNGATEKQGGVEAWQRELDDPATTPDRRRQVINEWTAVRVTDAANRGTECLKAAGERDAAWNTQRAEVVSCARTAVDEFRRIDRAMSRLPGADTMEVGKLVSLGIGVLARNAETAYKKTLYPNEHYRPGELLRAIEGEPMEGDEIADGIGGELARAAGGLGALVGCVGGICAPAGTLSATGLATVAGVAAGMAVVAGGLFSIVQAGQYLHMRATLPEMGELPLPE